MFKNKYRIITDGFLGYEVQTKKRWFPIMWLECWANGPSNTHRSVPDAEMFIKDHRAGVVDRVVKYID